MKCYSILNSDYYTSSFIFSKEGYITILNFVKSLFLIVFFILLNSCSFVENLFPPVPIQNEWKISLPEGIDFSLVYSNDGKFNSSYVNYIMNSSMSAYSAMHNKYPNPFSPNGTYRFQLTEDDSITIKIYSTDSTFIKTIFSKKLIPGYYELLLMKNESTIHNCFIEKRSRKHIYTVFAYLYVRGKK